MSTAYAIPTETRWALACYFNMSTAFTGSWLATGRGVAPEQTRQEQIR